MHAKTVVSGALVCCLLVWLFLPFRSPAQRPQRASRPRALRVTSDGHLVYEAPLIQADKETGYIKFPEGVTRVIVDVGTHARAPYTRPRLDKEADLAVIGYEPMRYQYGEISTTPIDGYGYGHPRMYVLNAAAGLTDQRGIHTFYRARSNMCSSLKRSVGKGCSTRGGERMRVPLIPLEDLLLHIDPQMEIPLIKVDAQGADLEVVKGAGTQLTRVQEWVLEVQTETLYEGAALEPEVMEFMRAFGYTLLKADPQSQGKEKNLHFTKKKKKNASF